MLNQYFGVPFADAGDKAAIPEATQPDGSVSMEQGFGPDYELPYTNPDSKDVPRDKSNQLSYLITKALQEYQQNGVPDWIDPSQNGGANFAYALHARVRYSDGVIYESIAAANNTLPTDATKWVPVGEGVAAIAGLTNANVVLTAEQASHPIITLAGGLTGNITITVPNAQRQWLVQNNTTGAFTITVKTAAGSGVVVPQGASMPVWGDGTNVIASGNGRLLNVRIFTVTGAYTPTPGTNSVRVTVIGGGGGGGGSAATGAGQCAAGAGGGGGGFAIKRLLTAFAGVTITIGAAGNGGVGAAGTAGGSTSFGAHVSATGGGGGSLGAAASAANFSANGSGAQGIGSNGDLNGIGGVGTYALYTVNPISGRGGGSYLGDGGTWVVGGYVSGSAGSTWGTGGSGSAATASQGIATGGGGIQGICIVEEFT